MYRYDIQEALKKYINENRYPNTDELIESISYSLSLNDLTLILKQLNIKED